VVGAAIPVDITSQNKTSRLLQLLNTDDFSESRWDWDRPTPEQQSERRWRQMGQRPDPRLPRVLPHDPVTERLAHEQSHADGQRRWKVAAFLDT
jgi:hypothetical protein